MDELIDWLNVAVCLVLALGCLWAVLSPRVRDGIVIKCGLGLASLGFAALGAALADDLSPVVVERALGLQHAGLLVIAAGVAWRWWRSPTPLRRLADWVTPPTVEQEPRR